MQEGQFTYNLYDADVWQNSGFDTKDEAIEAGNEAAKLCKKDKFFVGQVELVEVPLIDADDVTERLRESVYDDIGEVAEEFLLDASKEQVAELGEGLNGVYLAWLEKYGLKPNLYRVKNIEEVKVQKVLESEDEDENIRTADREFQETKTS